MYCRRFSPRMWEHKVFKWTYFWWPVCKAWTMAMAVYLAQHRIRWVLLWLNAYQQPTHFNRFVSNVAYWLPIKWIHKYVTRSSCVIKRFWTKKVDGLKVSVIILLLAASGIFHIAWIGVDVRERSSVYLIIYIFFVFFCESLITKQKMTKTNFEISLTTFSSSLFSGSLLLV